VTIARPVLVEFLGLSGAGKSAVSHQVAERLRRRGLPVREPTLRLAPEGRRRSVWKRALKTLHVARELVMHPLTSLRSLKSMSATRQQRLRLLFRMGFNWLMLSSLMRTHRRSLHLFDQGTFQALWSIGLEGRRGVVGRVGPRLVATVPAPDAVVVIEARPEVVADRLRVRGGRESRADRWDPATVQRSMRTMDEVRSVLRRMSARPGGPRILRVVNGRDDDVEAVADRVAVELELLTRTIEHVPAARAAAPERLEADGH